uniref:Uncharacterized protein n=1 Tax=Anguilla anguilla TaxID=7936 RepID=A0A0E9X6C3_ANGAN
MAEKYFLIDSCKKKTKKKTQRPVLKLVCFPPWQNARFSVGGVNLALVMQENHSKPI